MLDSKMRQDPRKTRFLAFSCIWVLLIAFGSAAAIARLRRDVPKGHAVAKPTLPEADLYNAEEALFKRGPRDLNEICLSFDDGPHPVASPAILTILHRMHVRATFFVVGKRLASHPEHVMRMLEEGHEVANHTNTHRRLDNLSPDEIRAEIKGCAREFEYVTNRGMTLLRPPGMRFNKTVLEVAKEMGYVTVGWNIGVRDYPTVDPKDLDHDLDYDFKGSPTVIADDVLKQAKKGTIILLHENMTTARALPRIIRTLREAGYKFRTVTQLLAEVPGAPKIVANPPAGVVP